jgi:hypothetical protein
MSDQAITILISLTVSAIVNLAAVYVIYHRFRHLGFTNRVQASRLRRFQVSTAESTNKLTAVVNELIAREEAARNQRESFNRALLKILRDNLNLRDTEIQQPVEPSNPFKRKAIESKSRPEEKIVLHERTRF